MLLQVLSRAYIAHKCQKCVVLELILPSSFPFSQ
jgi:phage FluMu protein Com